MTTAFRRLVSNNVSILNHVSSRRLTTSETSTILRPFYFAVHPDLFGQYPKERDVNETSLKKLNAYLQYLHGEVYPEPLTLTFYLRQNITTESVHAAAVIRHLYPVTFTLSSQDIRSTVKHILTSCNISTEQLNTIAVKDESFPRPIRWDPTYYTYTGKTPPSGDTLYHQSKPKPQTLRYWMQMNISKAQKKLEANKPLEAEIKDLSQSLCNEYGIKDIQWHSGWGLSAYRACLHSLSRLSQQQHADEISVLRGRCLIFSSSTGVSRNGSIVLSNIDVPHHWLMLLGSVGQYEALLRELPDLESAISMQLGNIQIIQRENIRVLLAEDYHNLLSRMLRSVVNYYRRKNHMFVSEYSGSYYGDVTDGPDKPLQGTLQDLHMLVENDAGDVRLLSTGQFLVPATYPPVLLLEYILDKQKQARYQSLEYQRYETLMKTIMKCCEDELDLDSLTKDNAVAPDEMIMCCQRLLDHRHETGIPPQRLKLKISKFYSVSQDGEMCIPWDWEI